MTLLQGEAASKCKNGESERKRDGWKRDEGLLLNCVIVRFVTEGAQRGGEKGGRLVIEGLRMDGR